MLKGRNNFLILFSVQALVDQWIDFASNEIELPSAAWIYPILDIVPENREATNKAKGDIRKALDILNHHLETRTFLVGERVSLADIVVSMSLYRLYQLVCFAYFSLGSFSFLIFRQVLDPGFRKGWKNLNRWFLTLVHQHEFASVIGEVHLCEKMAVAKAAPKAAAPKKEAPKKEPAAAKPKPAPKKKEEDEEEDNEFKEEKKKSKLDSLPKSKLDMEEWKRTYSNNGTRDVALPWLWEHFDPEGRINPDNFFFGPLD